MAVLRQELRAEQLGQMKITANNSSCSAILDKYFCVHHDFVM